MNWKRSFLLITFTASALMATPQLQLSTGALGIINIASGSNGPTQNVSATNTGDGSLSLSVSSTASWLAASATSSGIQIGLSTSALTPGTYTEFVTVNSPGAIDAPQTISVTVQIVGAPATLQLYATPNGGTATAQFTTQSTVNAAPSTSSGGNWLAVALNGQGSFAFYFPYIVTVTAQPGQAEGAYNGTIVTSGGSGAADNKSIGVTFNVTSQPIAQYGASPLLVYGVAGGPAVTAPVTVNNIGQGTLTISGGTATTASGGNWLSATAANNALTLSADPSGLQPGTYRGTLTLTGNAANAAANPLPVEFIVSSAAGPQITVGQVLDNATFSGRAVISPGEIVAIKGTQLAGSAPAAASTLPLTTNLGGVQVFVNNLPAPIFYTSSNQINFIVPSAVQPGAGTVSATYNGQKGNTVSTTIAARAPRMLQIQTASANYGLIVNQDGSFPLPATPGLNAHPARAGDTLVIYAIGLGPANPPVADGAGSPSSPLARTDIPTVNFGGGFASPAIPGQVTFAGLAPGYVGLYQINVVVPQGVPTGNAIYLQFFLDGVASNGVSIAIGQ